MKAILRNLLILLFPFALMIIINEYSREKIQPSTYQSRGQDTINSAQRDPSTCTWACHNDTGYCKAHHVKFDDHYFTYTDPLYFGMITVLRGFGNYGLANILLLVLFFPLLIYTLLIKSLKIKSTDFESHE